MRRKIRFAIVGLGHIGKRHASVIFENNNAELVAVCDVLSPKELNWVNNEVPFFCSLSDMLESGIGVDVVNICTPNGMHASQAIEILEAGNHVVVEKPMALNKVDVENIIFKALQVSRFVFTVMQNRYSPPAKWLKQILQDGILGKIFMVQINCFWNRDDRYYKSGSWHGTQTLDGGVLYTQFSHFVDIMYWLFGDIYNFRGNFKNLAHKHSTAFEDVGSVIFDFKDGGMGNINYSTAVWDKNMESSITIVAEKGYVKISGQYMNSVESCHIMNYEMPELGFTDAPNYYIDYQGSASNHAEVINNVVDTLNGETEIATNAQEALKVIDIIERIYLLRGPGDVL